MFQQGLQILKGLCPSRKSPTTEIAAGTRLQAIHKSIIGGAMYKVSGYPSRGSLFERSLHHEMRGTVRDHIADAYVPYGIED